jgi:hypothetical protein
VNYFLIGIPFMGIFLCIGQLPPPRQVSIGGMILPRQTLQDLDPRAQIPNSQPLKSALKQSTDYSYMIDSPLQALFVDTCIACSLCATGMCATCTLYPQLSLVAHFTTNSIVCSCVLGYWLTDQEEVFKNAQINAGKDLISQFKNRICSITRSILAYDEEKKNN